MKIVVSLAAVLALAGCAEPVYNWSKAGSHSFEQDSQACKDDIAKRIRETPKNYIAMEGNHLQSSGEWAQRTYNECMRTAGYTPTGEMNSTAKAAPIPAPVPVTAKAVPMPAPVPVTALSSPPSAASTNMAGRLRELRGLLDQGLISQVEYDQRRQRLLDSM
jgi:hypothetical protein